MQVQVTRGDVAAGDDPGMYTFETTAVTLAELLNQLLSQQYLPLIAGGRATWSVVSRKPLAVLAQQWPQPQLLFTAYDPANWLTPTGLVRLHLNYHGQQDPEIVYQSLADLRFPGR